MKTIYKYKIPLGPNEYGRFVINMPSEATFLSVQQGYMWFLVDTKSPLADRQFVVYGTGHEIKDNPEIYLGTYLLPPWVWHLFFSPTILE